MDDEPDTFNDAIRAEHANRRSPTGSFRPRTLTPTPTKETRMATTSNAHVWGYSPAKAMLRGPVFWGNGGRLGENNGGEAPMEFAIAGTGLGIIGLLVVILLVILIVRAL
jgi:hypothetical protein